MLGLSGVLLTAIRCAEDQQIARLGGNSTSTPLLLYAFLDAYQFILHCGSDPLNFELMSILAVVLVLAVPHRIPAHGRVLVQLQTGHVLLRQSEIKDLRVLQDTRVGYRLGQRHISLNAR